MKYISYIFYFFSSTFLQCYIFLIPFRLRNQLYKPFLRVLLLNNKCNMRYYRYCNYIIYII